jgi:uncharacterized LabA/DUF88 family protein
LEANHIGGLLAPRTIVYIDGFNLYYGVFKEPHFRRYRWLDFDAYFSRLLPAKDIVRIKYCSALVDRTRDPGAYQRQYTYWEALRTLRLTTLIEGRFKDKSVICRSVGCTFTGNKSFTTPEEKGTDVNIALEMLDDAYQGSMDELVLVSGDSDLAPALQKVRLRFPRIRITLYVPAAYNRIRGRAPELRSLAHKHRNFDGALCAHCQLPAQIQKPDGAMITKPPTW